MAKCIRCQKELTNDEIGLHKKMINRGATEFMCISCLADYFQCSADLLKDKIKLFRSMGCMLFSSEENMEK